MIIPGMELHGTELIEALRQLKEERVMVLNGLPATTFLFFMILLVAFQVLWLWQGPYIPFYTQSAVEDSGLYFFVAGLGLALVLGILHYIALYYAWHRLSRLAQQLVGVPSFVQIFCEDDFLADIANATQAGRWSRLFIHSWPGSLLSRIEFFAAFLVVLPVWAGQRQDWEGFAQGLAFADWLASITGVYVARLGHLTEILPRHAKILGWLGMLLLYPLLFPGGHPYMCRNAGACAVVERLLEEQVKPAL
jgi:hypothetical protein